MDEGINRFKAGWAVPPAAKPVTTVWNVIRCMHRGAEPVTIVLYAAFTEKEAYDYAQARFPNKRKWWKVRIAEVKRSDPVQPPIEREYRYVAF